MQQMDFIRVLKKAELHNLVERLKLVLDSTASDSETEGCCIKKPWKLTGSSYKVSQYPSLPYKIQPKQRSSI